MILLKIYKILTVVLSPFLKTYFYFRCLCKKDKFDCVKNHFGKPTIDRRHGKYIWVHAVSVGEAISAITFIKHIKKCNPDINVLLTTTTVTSANLISEKITKISGCYHQFVPADNPFWIKKFLKYWRVDAVFFLESEIWPNTIEELKKNRIPTFLLNARLSPKSFKRWSFFKRTFSYLVKKFTAILAQSNEDAERFTKFSSKNVYTIDNLKYANELLPCNDELLKVFKQACKGRKVLVAASTHHGEETIIIKAHKLLKEKFDIITVIIPRHLNRVKKISDELLDSNITFELRSNISNSSINCDVYIIDSFGEVGTFYRLADVCFVGGSLVPIGGHNIYEPVSLGKPVLHGPFMDNSIETRNMLKNANLAFEIHNCEDIVARCDYFFSNKSALLDVERRSIEKTSNKSLEQIDFILQNSSQFNIT